jgi:large subunit ribosomal protein L28
VEDSHRKARSGPQDGAQNEGVKRRLKLYSPAMAKVCHVCSKGPAFGNSRSHSMVATRRRFDPNLQRVRIDDNGTPRRVYVCTRCLKAGKVTKAA